MIILTIFEHLLMLTHTFPHSKINKLIFHRRKKTSTIASHSLSLEVKIFMSFDEIKKINKQNEVILKLHLKNKSEFENLQNHKLNFDNYSPLIKFNLKVPCGSAAKSLKNKQF